MACMFENTVEQRRLEAMFRARRNFPKVTNALMHTQHMYIHSCSSGDDRFGIHCTLCRPCMHAWANGGVHRSCMHLSSMHACCMQVAQNLKTMSFHGRKAALYKLLGTEEGAFVYELLNERMPELWDRHCKLPPVIVLKLPRPWPKKHKCVAISLGLGCKGHVHASQAI